MKDWHRLRKQVRTYTRLNFGSSRKLASALNASDSEVSQWLNGKIVPRPHRREAISAWFGGQPKQQLRNSDYI